MISYEVLVQKPRVFQSVKGLSVDEFDRLFRKFVPKWVEQEYARLSRPDRKRAIGGGGNMRLG